MQAHFDISQWVAFPGPSHVVDRLWAGEHVFEADRSEAFADAALHQVTQQKAKVRIGGRA